MSCDGAETMDVHVPDVAEANAAVATPHVETDGRHGTVHQPAERAAPGHGDGAPELDLFMVRASDEIRSPPLAEIDEGRDLLVFTALDHLEAGLADLVVAGGAVGASSRTSRLDRPRPPRPVGRSHRRLRGDTVDRSAPARPRRGPGATRAVAPLLYVDPRPFSVVRRRRPGGRAPSGPALQLIAPGLARLTPTAPPLHQRPGVKPLSLAVTRRAMARAVAALGSPSVEAVIVLSLNPLFGACGERTRVFYAGDDYIAGASLMRIAPVRLRRLDRRQPADADLVVTVSEVLADHYGRWVTIRWSSRTAATSTTTPAPSELPSPEALPDSPVCGLIGTLSRRIDVSLLEAVADADISLLLVGGRPSGADSEALDHLLGRPQVRWVGPHPFDELPSYLRVMDVGLVPYSSTHPFNRASAPLKVLEYLAAGRPVVSTDLPAVRQLDTDLVTIAEEPQEFAAAVAEAVRTAHDPELVARRQAFAARHSWAVRLEPFVRALDLGGIDQINHGSVSPRDREVTAR